MYLKEDVEMWKCGNMKMRRRGVSKRYWFKNDL